MGLLDLFDGDKRSKAELRDELQAAEARHAAAAVLFNETKGKLEAAELRAKRLTEQLSSECAAQELTLSKAVHRERSRLEPVRLNLEQREEELVLKRSRHQGAVKALFERRAVLKQREEAVEQGEVELQEQRAALESDQAALETLRVALDKQQRRLAVVTANLTEREERVKKDAAAAALEESGVHQRDARVTEREIAVSVTEKAQVTNEQALQARRDAIREMEARIDRKREVIDRAGKLEERESVVGRREDAVKRREDARQVVEDQLRDARSKVGDLEKLRQDLERRLAEINRTVQAHQARVVTLERSVEAAEGRAAAAESRTRKAESANRLSTQLVKQLQAELDQPFLLRVSDESLLGILAALHAETVIDALGHEPVTLGSGPWPEETYDTALEQASFVPQLLDEYAADFEVFIVGTTGVEIDELAQVLESRMEDSLPVRLYSQELWLLYLMTGQDPLMLEPELLRDAFGLKHPVLGAFVNPEWDWPELGVASGGSGGDVFSLERGASPLHGFGYRAGVGTLRSERRKTLEEFLACKSLLSYFDADHHDTDYRNSWGRPSSGGRLRRMVNHVRWLYRFQGASPRKIQARNDWREDLEWMRKTLGPKFGF